MSFSRIGVPQSRSPRASTSYASLDQLDGEQAQVYEMLSPDRWNARKSRPSAYTAPSDGVNAVSSQFNHTTFSDDLPLLSPKQSTSQNHPSPSPSLLIPPKSPKRAQLSGWRKGMAIAGALAGTILLVNVILTIYACVRATMAGGIGTLYHGSCSKTRTMSTWLHLAINALSTILLGASNYCMQCSVAPTRKEVDMAHAKGVWLDIGVPSVRNLHHISWKRVSTWWLLALSSVPLHLMFNSAIFESLIAEEYMGLVVGAGFPSGADWNHTLTYSQNFGYDIQSHIDIIQSMQDQAVNFTLQHLENKECIQTYNNQIISGRRNLLLVVADTAKSNSTIFWAQSQAPSDASKWMWGGRPSLQSALANADSWQIRFYPIAYCLSETVPEDCKLQFSLPIMIVVIFCNLVKGLCMLLTVLKQKHTPLVTFGDAVASFLDTPDPTTAGRCTMSKLDVTEGKWASKQPDGQLAFLPAVPQEYTSSSTKCRGHYWFRAASVRRWLFCNALCFITLIGTTVLLAQGIYGLTNQGLSTSQAKSLSNLWAMGFGAVNANSLVAVINAQGNGGLFAIILLSNLPQAILSFLYLMYNGLFTCMLQVKEWSQFCSQRKALRVSSPTGAQRSTYFLQLPYIYSVPLMILSGILHWLVSQSIFLAKVTVYKFNGLEDPSADISTCGYSNIAIIFTLGVGTIVAAAGILNGFRRFKSGIPLVASCSAAISAACHAPADDVDASLRPVMWGEVKMERAQVGHCCFSSQKVEGLIAGKLYAG